MEVIVLQLLDLVEKIRLCHSGAAAATATAASHTQPTSGQSKTGTSSTVDAETRQKQEIIRNSPAVKFLTRTDFFSLVQYSDVSVYFI